MEIEEVQEFIDSGLCSVVEEPAHSTQQIKLLKEKYNISNEDWSWFCWNLEFFIQCKGKVDDLG